MITVPESDWKILYNNRGLYLERLCLNINNQIDAELRNGLLSEHKKYLNVYKSIQVNDKLITFIFNRFSRSNFYDIVYDVVLNDLCGDEIKMMSEESKEKFVNIYKLDKKYFW